MIKKLLFFIIPFLFTINVYALDVNVTSSITSPNDPTQGRYSGTEIYNTGTDNVYQVGTRYNGKLSRIRFNLPLPSELGQCFSTGVTYTVTLNMATSDWRNKFGEVSASAYNRNFALGGVPTYVSMKKIYFNVKLPTSIDYCVDYLFVDIQSTNVSTTAFTGESNWNLSSIILTDPTYTSGGSSTPTPTPVVTPDFGAIISNQNQNTQDIIDNQNQNTNDIISSNIDNTSNIIENNNNNTSDILTGLSDVGEQVIQSSTDIINYQKSIFEDCSMSVNLINLNKNSQTTNGITLVNNSKGTLTFNGTTDSVLSSQISHYINIPAAGTYYLSLSKTGSFSGGNVSIILYGRNEGSGATNIFLQSISSGNGWVFNIPSTYDYYYLWLYVPIGITFNDFSISPQLEQGSSFTSFQEFGKMYCSNRLEQQTQSINDINDTMKNDDIDDKTGFFTGFDNNMHGLSGIITAPLTTIQGLVNNTCTPLEVPIPFTNSNVILPCMNEVYRDVLGGYLYSIIQSVITGIISYFICLDIFRIVKGFKDPTEDKIEVLDL